MCALRLCTVTLPEPDTHPLAPEPKEHLLEKLHQQLWPLLTIIFVPQVHGGVEVISHVLWLGALGVLMKSRRDCTGGRVCSRIYFIRLLGVLTCVRCGRNHVPETVQT